MKTFYSIKLSRYSIVLILVLLTTVTFSKNAWALGISVDLAERDLNNDLRFGQDINQIDPTLNQQFGYNRLLVDQWLKFSDFFKFRLGAGSGRIDSGSWSFNSGNITVDGEGSFGFAWGTGLNWMIVKDSWGLKWYTDWDFHHINSDADAIDQELDTWNTTFGVKRDFYSATLGTGLRYSDASLEIEGTKSGQKIAVGGDADQNVGLIFNAGWRINPWIKLSGNLRTVDELGGQLKITMNWLYKPNS